MPRSTVLIPAFNQAKLVAGCVRAVLEHDPCDVVVVDDGSTDGTAETLAGFGDGIRVVRHETNLGFAHACNDGAVAAETSEFLVLLNSDTVPQRGWLHALEQYADAHPQAAAVGSRLLYPDGTVQHAGVVFGQDRVPRHLYAGFPGTHPAVHRSRRFQAVTAACMLIRHDAFVKTGGFDTGFRNGLEDVDFCLRLGTTGAEVHYCHQSLVCHLESVCEGRFRHEKENLERFRDRWAQRLRPDDLSYYVADGLLQLDYEGTYPIRLKVSPLLATIDDPPREAEALRLLRLRSHQVLDLLSENIRLTAEVGGIACPPAMETAPLSDVSAADLGTGELVAGLQDAHEALFRRDQELQAQLQALQALLGERGAGRSAHLDYQAMQSRLRALVSKVVPPDGPVIVVSKGDNALLNLDGRVAWHFPQTPQGTYAGHHPRDSEEAIQHLEALRAKGGRYLVIPGTAAWMLEQYPAWQQHLDTHYELLADHERAGTVYTLDARRTTS